MELSEIDRLKEQAVNAITGHMPCTPDSFYDLGKALESVCEEVERLHPFERKAIDAEQTIDEQADDISTIKEKVKELANEVAAL